MTRLYLVTQGGRQFWVAALIDEDVWTYVGNTGKFHLNDGVRHDFFMLNEAEYSEIGISEAKRLIDSGVGHLDEDDAVLDRWHGGPKPLDPGEVLSMAAGFNP